MSFSTGNTSKTGWLRPCAKCCLRGTSTQAEKILTFPNECCGVSIGTGFRSTTSLRRVAAYGTFGVPKLSSRQRRASAASFLHSPTSQVNSDLSRLALLLPHGKISPPKPSKRGHCCSSYHTSSSHFDSNETKHHCYPPRTAQLRILATYHVQTPRESGLLTQPYRKRSLRTSNVRTTL